MLELNPAPKGKLRSTPPLDGYRKLVDVASDLGLTLNAIRSRLRNRKLNREPLVIVRHGVAWCHPSIELRVVDEDLELRGWVDSLELAESAGVTQQAIWGWCERNGFKRGVDYLIRANKRFIRDRRADEYLAGTSPHQPVRVAPHGWRDVKWLERETGAVGSYWHKVLVNRDDLRVVQLRQSLKRLIHPDDADFLKWEFMSSNAIGEWVTISDLAEELDRNYSSIRYAITKLGIESRILRVGEQRLQRAVQPGDAELIRKWARTAKRSPKSTSRTGTGYQPGASAARKALAATD